MTAEAAAPGELPTLQLPKAPVFGWSSLGSPRQSPLPSVDQREDRTYTSSGRAAIYVALQRIGVRAGDTVLVPSYHCPTMVAPLLLLGAQPVFYGINDLGLPLMDDIQLDPAHKPRAMLVAHYFGLPRSLAAVRAWCDRHRIALIEDCAHALFGLAGTRAVGRWGDHATASLTKFLPLPECGVVVSNVAHQIEPALSRRNATEHMKGCFDTLQMAAQYNRIWGLNGLIRGLVAWRKRYQSKAVTDACTDVQGGQFTASDLMAGADMARIGREPVALARLVASRLPRGQIVARRQANYHQFARLLAGRQGLRPLFDEPGGDIAPYVFPLWVDAADRVYGELRRLNAPVFRWDRLWPGIDTGPTDRGRLWSKHVLQLLCHQDLSPSDIDNLAHLICKLAASRSGDVSPT